ncbi:MAG: glycosyltransferase family 2 protein [bacterium]|nr:glycosyltransferase family 2 protein [bacterium]
MFKHTLVIPVYNNLDLLKKFLPGNLKYPWDEVIIVDDGSKDESSTWLQQTYPDITVIRHHTNQGFIKSVNQGFKKTKSDIVTLLNSDVLLKNNPIPVLNRFFKAKPKAFAVSFNEPQYSYAVSDWDGLFGHQVGPKSTKPHQSLYASGGSSAFVRSIWLKLGGFDPIYQPFYWEDVDISWRAKQAGYQIWWHPKIIVDHQHESTTSQSHNQKYKTFIIERNRLIFTLRHFWQTPKSREIIKYLIARCMKHPGYTKVVYGAVKRLFF